LHSRLDQVYSFDQKNYLIIKQQYSSEKPVSKTVFDVCVCMCLGSTSLCENMEVSTWLFRMCVRLRSRTCTPVCRVVFVRGAYFQTMETKTELSRVASNPDHVGGLSRW
jgi:hypothetical protein